MTGIEGAAYSRAMSQLLLIRHGQASFGTDNYDLLSPTGERQARLVGHHMAAAGLIPDILLAGSLARQQKTATLAANAWTQPPALRTDPAFNEYDADALFAAYLPRVLDEDTALAAQRDGISADRRLFQKAFEQVMGHWLAGTSHEHPRCESWVDFRARVGAALARLRDELPRDCRIGVFSSGGPIAVAISAAMAASDDKTIELNWSIYNASISDLRSTRSGWRLLGFNDISALHGAGDPALVTFR
ncbi:histidine phosphatase family protein [Salinisphaera aquimarina]